MESKVKIERKNLLETLHEMANDGAECISQLQTAFMYNSGRPLSGMREKAEAYVNEAGHLSIMLKEAAQQDQSLEPYVPVPEHLQAVWKQIARLTERVERKVLDRVLFSDRAVDETMFLLQRLTEILRPTAEMILARNRFLSRYIEESQASIEKSADEYATLHENRLSSGECVPAASPLYIAILDSIKSIAWHTKDIATTLGK